MSRLGASLLLLGLWSSASSTVAQTNVIVPSRSLWRYWDANSTPGQNWFQPGFNDSQWTFGTAPLGFGEPNVSLIQNSIMTAYFRRSFTLTNMPESWLTLRVRRDDGVVVYLNGTEIFRNNMPQGTVSHFTAALADVEATSFVATNVGAAFFLPGQNVMAAEVHQYRITSDDMLFDLELFGTNGGPRLVMTAPANNASIRTGSDIAIEALAEPVSEIASVAFYQNDVSLGIDASAPFGVIWPQAPAGTHLLRAVATTHDGFSFGSAPIRIQIADAFPPSGAITNPPPNATLQAGDITLQAIASDPDGTVTLVEFFANGIKLGEDAVAPYSFQWQNAGVGDYTIVARITDDTGVSSDTTSIFIRVKLSLGVLRGPYLQSGTSTSIIVKWRTEAPSDSLVRYGTSAENLNQNVREPESTAEHEVEVTGLMPDTRYYYSVGSSSGIHATGAGLFFVTSPANSKPTRIWVIGDSGTASPDARAVYDAYLAYTGDRYTDVWLMLGDNAYGSGTDDEYQRAVFEMYPGLLAQTVVWPTIGNHDASPAYFNIFALPRNGEAGGTPSGVENYYSFDYSDIHFICLGGYYSGSLSSNGTMCAWLQADLQANTNKWIIAYWHQPPYTHGSHNSDYEPDLIAMRENAVPILESYGVDLVLSGHSHCYERSFLMRGHYGLSSELDRESMLLDQGSGRVEESGPYVKEISGPTAQHGTVYVVAGSSGFATFGSMDHPAMHTSWLRMGSLVLDIDGDRLDATFLRENGVIDDSFTIIKRSTVLRITAVSVNGATSVLSWESVRGRSYQIDFRASLAEGWTKVHGPITATGPFMSEECTRPGATSGFYRVMQLD